MSRFVLAGGLLSVVECQQLKGYDGYSYADFTSDFGVREVDGDSALQFRKNKFSENLDVIRKHNAEYIAGKHTWWMSMNQFGDWSKEEFRAMQTYKGSKEMRLSSANLDILQAHQLPESKDWRKDGVVTDVKNQGMCGSCWAFASTQTVESALAIATKKLVVLAPQTYVSCMKNPNGCGGTGGCSGGISELAFNYTQHYGIYSEADYPYEERTGTCNPPSAKPAAFVQGFVKLPVNNADALATALAKVGPVAISIATSGMMSYGGGVFAGCTEEAEGGMVIDHAVQAVGYAKEYWIVRNSWGPNWGEHGYIRMTRSLDDKIYKDRKTSDGTACKPYPDEMDVAGACGILSDSAYPTGAADHPSVLTQSIVV